MIVANVAYVSFVRLETTGRPTGIDIDNVFWMSVQAYGKNYDPVAGTKADLAFLKGLPDVISAARPTPFRKPSRAFDRWFLRHRSLRGRRGSRPSIEITDPLVDTLGATPDPRPSAERPSACRQRR